jgi:hypothetical protein
MDNNIHEHLAKFLGKYQGFFDEKLYKIAYELIKSKPGNMTPGIDGKTLEGISTD